MILKKFYGNNIRAAMKEAKEKLGEEIVLLESVPAEGDRPASITVMLDKAEEQAPEQQEDNEFSNVLYKRSDVRKGVKRAASKDAESSGRGTTDTETETQVAEKEKKQEGGIDEESPDSKTEKPDDSKTKRSDTGQQEAKDTGSKKKETKNVDVEEQEEQDEDDLPEPKGLDQPGAGMSRRDRSLIEISDTVGKNGFYKDSSVSREISALHRRFDQVESMLGEALISANLDYASHEAFQQLLDAGVRTTTISRWFKTILNQGVDPYEDRESFMYELAKIVRDALTITLPDAVQPNLVFVGPSGAGKTSLIMKLAESPDFMGEKKVALVTVEPRNTTKKYTVLGLFAEEQDIDYFTVKDGIDVSKLMPKLVHYDHVLFDTPSISLEKKTAFREYWKIRQILASVMPLEVHFVINATMENYYFREKYATDHPLQPDYVAITHLDETKRWGHLIPFLKTLGCSVRYMAQGASVPDDIEAFSPTWFAEKILSNNT